MPSLFLSFIYKLTHSQLFLPAMYMHHTLVSSGIQKTTMKMKTKKKIPVSSTTNSMDSATPLVLFCRKLTRDMDRIGESLYGVWLL